MAAEPVTSRKAPVGARAFVLVLAATALITFVVAGAVWRPSTGTPGAVEALAVAIAWALTEASPLIVSYRRDSAVIVPVEAVAVPALLVLPGPLTVLAGTAGTFLAFGLLQLLPPVAKMRTRSPMTVAFNRAATVVALGVAVLAAAAVSTLGGAPVTAAVVGVFVFWLSSRTSVMVLLRLLHGDRRGGSGSGDGAGTLAGDIGEFAVVTGAGLLFGVALLDGGLSTWWLAGMTAVLAAGARLLARSTITQARLQDLLRVADDVQAQVAPAEIDTRVLAAARDLLGCGDAVLAPEPGPPGTLSEPLPAADPPVWLVVRDRRGLSRRFDADDAALLRGLALIASAALDRGRLVDRLRTEDELKSMVLAAVAHDLRAPLAVATASSQTLQRYRDRLTPEREHELLDGLDLSLARIAGITGQLLDLKRLEMTAGPRRAAECRLDEVASDVATTLAAGTDIDIRVVASATSVAMSEALLRHVVGNLLDNARKHAPTGSEVTCHCYPDGDRAVLAVEDRGVGVPAESRAAILQPFEQAGPAATRWQGVGLGLYLVDRFVAVHGGTLAIEDREGGGTRFVVRLPRPADDDAGVQTPATQLRRR